MSDKGFVSVAMRDATYQALQVLLSELRVTHRCRTSAAEVLAILVGAAATKAQIGKLARAIREGG